MVSRLELMAIALTTNSSSGNMNVTGSSMYPMSWGLTEEGIGVSNVTETVVFKGTFSAPSAGLNDVIDCASDTGIAISTSKVCSRIDFIS